MADLGKTRGRRLTARAATVAIVAAGTLAVTAPWVLMNGDLPGLARRPAVQPRGATAQCVDGSYSFSLSRSSACWGHGGVKKWLR